MSAGMKVLFDGLRCVMGHEWKGCSCGRCGKQRDQDHDWDHCRCRRCGSNRGEHHQWVGCVCVLCGVSDHQWSKGKCIACGCDVEGKQGIHDGQTHPGPNYDSSFSYKADPPR